jgi:tetratricopeptide (TPR) repeat protein
MLVRTCIAAVVVTLAWAAPASSQDPAAVVAAKRLLQQGVDRGDVARVLEARARFQALASLEPRAALLHYWVAVADWRAVTLLLNGKDKDRDKAERHCKAGLAAAERAIELDPKMGGALAVQGGLLGLSLSFKSPVAMMTIGPQLDGVLGRAAGLAPDDPRVHLLDGINTLHKPAFVGGGPKPALAKFARAIERFAAETVTDSLAADWGRDDAHLWAGRAAMKLEDYAAAKRHFDDALAANPQNGWVRTALLPEAEKAIAAGASEEKR